MSQFWKRPAKAVAATFIIIGTQILAPATIASHAPGGSISPLTERSSDGVSQHQPFVQIARVTRPKRQRVARHRARIKAPQTVRRRTQTRTRTLTAPTPDPQAVGLIIPAVQSASESYTPPPPPPRDTSKDDCMSCD